ncbi:hypothetical protein TWF481_009841 [Arthrobotrys musiformis]|uniref:WD40 repeat domain-containing protein n=1 Tax=Arthrobotrys musiformis TaxID=47236 RepID=A0AAV9W4Y6_9PEZI
MDDFFDCSMAISTGKYGLTAALKGFSRSTGCDFVEFWDVEAATILERLELTSFRSDQHLLSFSLDGSLLAAVAVECIFVWDVIDMVPNSEPLSMPWKAEQQAHAGNSEPGLLSALEQQNPPSSTIKLCLRFKIKTGFKASSLEFSPDGKLIAFVSGNRHTYDRTVEVWNNEKGELFRKWHIFSPPETQLRFSPDGNQLLSYSGYEIQIWLISSGELLKRFEDVLGSAYSVPEFYRGGPQYQIRMAALSHQNTLLALNVSYEGQFQTIIKDVETGETVQKITRTEELSLLSFSEGDFQLETNRGLFNINRRKNYENDGVHGTLGRNVHSLLADEHQEWICLNGEKILWLPHKYRPAHSDPRYITIQENTVAIKTGDNRLIFIEIEPWDKGGGSI